MLNNIAYPGYPLGHALVDVSGTRTVYTATAADPTSYSLNSTANLVGVLPAHSCYLI